MAGRRVTLDMDIKKCQLFLFDCLSYSAVSHAQALKEAFQEGILCLFLGSLLVVLCVCVCVLYVCACLFFSIVVRLVVWHAI